MNLPRTKYASVLATLTVAYLLCPMSPADADDVINDDLIVIGSTSIGFDSVNGETFGFDTLKLKENNTRLTFLDTSVIGNFPRRDWRIRANEATNGGRNAFFIDDMGNNFTDGTENAQVGTPFTIEAGAPTNAIVIDNIGRLGIREGNPVVEVHSTSGDTPTVRFEQDGTSGWTPQTWDVAGNEANFFVRDVTNGSRLPLRIRPGAPTNSVYIADTGVGIGTSNPTHKLHVQNGELQVVASSGAIRAGTFVQDNSGGNVFVGVENSAGADTGNTAGFVHRLNTTTQARTAGRMTTAFTDTTDATRRSELRFANANAGAFAERLRIDGDRFALNRTSVQADSVLQVGTAAIDGNGARLTNVGVWTNGSSRENKQHITPLDAGQALETIVHLEPVTYVGKDDPSEEHYVGFIAEDVPELVAMNARDGIAAIEVVAVVTRVVQEQQKTIESQQQQIAELMQRLERLESARQ